MTTEKKPGTESLPLTVQNCYARSKARHSEPSPDCLLDTWEEQTQKLSRTFRRGYVASLPNAEALEAYLAEHLALAEARGAAEQRQKDLEKAGGVQPNVVALEARVKELEGTLVEITNIKTRDAPYLTDSRYQDRVMWALVECRRKARAAIREGEQA